MPSPALPSLPTRLFRRRLAGGLNGPHPALPRPLDAVCERWARLPPRVRTLIIIVTALGALAAGQARVRAAESRWGGVPVPALVATEDLHVGEPAVKLRRVLLPPEAVPASAMANVRADQVLALALPAGAVLTRAHLDSRGPAAGLDLSLRAVPIPVEDGWGVAAGGWVDVWVLGAGEAPASLVSRSRAVLEVRSDGARVTALVALGADEVSAATAGLALGKVLLTHAPAPGAGSSAGDRVGQ